MPAGAPSSGSSVARPDLPVVQRDVVRWSTAGTSARLWRSLRPDGSASTPATSTMMIMVTTPVSVVTYAIVAGDLVTATPATPSIRLSKAL